MTEHWTLIVAGPKVERRAIFTEQGDTRYWLATVPAGSHVDSGQFDALVLCTNEFTPEWLQVQVLDRLVPGAPVTPITASSWTSAN